MQLYASIASHVAMLPAIVLGWRNGRRTECVIGLASVITSVIYHCLDTIGGEFADMSALRWHRLDNVTSQITFVGIAIALMQNSDARTDEIIRWSFGLIIVVLQERAPWEVMWTVLPIAASALVCTARWCYQKQTPVIVPWAFRGALVVGVAAAACFVKGLDDEHDFARLWHSGWHVCVGMLAYLLAESTSRFDRARKGAGDAARQHLSGWALSARERESGKERSIRRHGWCSWLPVLPCLSVVEAQLAVIRCVFSMASPMVLLCGCGKRVGTSAPFDSSRMSRGTGQGIGTTSSGTVLAATGDCSSTGPDSAGNALAPLLGPATAPRIDSESSVKQRRNAADGGLHAVADQDGAISQWLDAEHGKWGRGRSVVHDSMARNVGSRTEMRVHGPPDAAGPLAASALAGRLKTHGISSAWRQGKGGP